MREVMDTLKNLKQNIQKQLLSESGLLLRPPVKRPTSSARLNTDKNPSYKLLDLPLKKKKKKIAANRVGQKTDLLHKMSGIKIPPNVPLKDENTLETHIIDNEENSCMGLDEFISNYTTAAEIVLSDTEEQEDHKEPESRSLREKITAGDLSTISNNRMLTDNVILVFQQND